MKKIKSTFLYVYLSLVAVSLFLIAFSLSYSVVRFYDQNDFPNVSLSSIGDARRTISEIIPKPYVVYSGSMEPTIKTASLIFTLPLESYSKGDIVTFQKTGSKNTITHRIEAITYEDGLDNPVFLTSGDANEEIDQGSIKKENIVGKVFLIVPYVGHMVDFAKTPKGFILLVIVPATIIIYEELKTLFISIKGFSKRNVVKDEIDQQKNDSHKALNTFKLPKLTITIPFIGVFIVFLGLSASYFFDKEESIGNILGVGIYGENVTPTPTPGDTLPSPTPTPTPGLAQTLVINEILPSASCTSGNTEGQWIELFNGYNFAINPKNFQITDGVNVVDLVTANNLSIEPGGLLLLAHNSSIWGTNPNSCWDNNGTQTGNLGGLLNINVGELRILDSQGETVDTIIWNSNSLTPLVDESIARNPNGYDSAYGSNFEVTDFQIYQNPNPGLYTP